MATQDSEVALVTGATSGIGLEIARRLGKEGLRVFVCARGEEGLRTTLKELREAGVEADGRTCDVRSVPEIEALVAAVVERYGPVDVLVNNAGRPAAAPRPNSPTNSGSMSWRPTSPACSG